MRKTLYNSFPGLRVINTLDVAYRGIAPLTNLILIIQVKAKSLANQVNIAIT